MAEWGTDAKVAGIQVPRRLSNGLCRIRDSAVGIFRGLELRGEASAPAVTRDDRNG